jgi:hypothetical protein
LVLYDAELPQGVTEPSKPGFVRRLLLLCCRHGEQVAPLQPLEHVVGAGATHAPLPLHVDAPRALPFEHDGAPQAVAELG